LGLLHPFPPGTLNPKYPQAERCGRRLEPGGALLVGILYPFPPGTLNPKYPQGSAAPAPRDWSYSPGVLSRDGALAAESRGLPRSFSSPHVHHVDACGSGASHGETVGRGGLSASIAAAGAAQAVLTPSPEGFGLRASPRSGCRISAAWRRSVPTHGRKALPSSGLRAHLSSGLRAHLSSGLRAHLRAGPPVPGAEAVRR
jgi:hypothetical protein